MNRILLFTILCLSVINSFGADFQRFASIQQKGSAYETYGKYFIVGYDADNLDANGNNSISSSGKVLIFKKDANGFNLIKTLVAPDRVDEGANLYFGHSVAMNDEFLIVGANGADLDENGQNYFQTSGAAYLFGKNVGGNDNWGFIRKIITPSARRPSNFMFGDVVEISDSLLAITEPHAEHYVNGNYVDIRPYVHIYERNRGGNNNWGLAKSEFRPDNIIANNFGCDIELTSNHVIIAAYGNTRYKGSYVYYGGRVFIYDHHHNRNGDLVVKNVVVLKNNDYDQSPNYFGCSIDTDGNRLIVGSRGDRTDENGQNNVSRAGSVFVYNFNSIYNQWNLEQKIVAPARNSNMSFGLDLEIVEDTLIVSAPGKDSVNVDSTFSSKGSVFVFVNENNSWSHNGNFYDPNWWSYLRSFGYELAYNGSQLFTRGSLDYTNYIGRIHIFNRNAVAVTSTTWNGNSWSNGQPNSTIDAVIEDDLNIAQSITCKTLTLTNNPIINIAQGETLSIIGNIEGAATFTGDGKVLINGSAANVETNDDLIFNNLEIDNDFDLVLGGSLSVNGLLTLTDGHIELGNNNLIVATSTSFVGGSGNSYLKINGNGVVQVTQSRGSSRLYPIGYNPYLPIEIEIPAAGNFDNRTFELSLINGIYENPETNDVLQDDNVVGKTWFVNPTAVASNVSVTVYWPQSEEIGTFNRALSSLSYWSEGFGSWINQNFAAANGNDPYNKTVTGVYFSPFADLWFGVGSTGSALPVEFTNFEVEHNSFNNSAILNWQTAMEENNSHFEIERSFSATDWEKVERVEGQGNTFDITDYQFIDQLETLNSKPETIYYRLKQVDYNGAFEYSEIRTLNFKQETRNSFELWPNPVAGNVINLSAVDDYEVVTIEGIVIKRELATNQIDISALAEGTYMIRNKSGQVQTFIKN